MGWAAAFGALAGAMAVYPEAAAEAARLGLSLWARSVAPVLGPFMVCMLMASSRMGGGLWPRVLMGWLTGSPGGAKLTLAAGPRGRSALRCAALTGTMSPLFFLGTVGTWLGSEKMGGMILLCHWLGALMIGLCVRADMRLCAPASPMLLSDALRESAVALAAVALCMMLGCAAARMAESALPFLSPAAAAALQCALEVTSGVKALIALQSPLTAPLVCAACSFGGLSLLMQNAAFWQAAGVGMGQLLILRLFHGALSFALCFLLTQMIH